MRLHLVALPHAQTTAQYATCAYTQKVRKFGRMMTDAGHEVVIYSGDENDAICAEHVEIFTETERVEWFGKHNLQALHPPVWEPEGEWWQLTNTRAAEAILEHRDSERDLVLISGGACQRPIVELVGRAGMISCEPFVGYEGTTTGKCAFESLAWQHHVYGIQQNRYPGAWDAVIPNYFDVDEFPDVRETAGGGKYVLFLGRVTERKGPNVASEIAQHLGLELRVAGPGVSRVHGKVIVGEGCRFVGKYVGAVGIKDRAKLLAGARCLIVPTRYVEPFGGVAVEAMLAGVPVLASDFGAFTETVTVGTGRRFNTLQEALDGFDECDRLDPAEIRREAVERFSLDAVAPLFTRWLARLSTLWGDGWYQLAATYE